ncbi:MAG TPA: beta-xylosidase [Bryobacteraceae bacterium]|nr:beta-xylosidase [Bryobacteraceae bacterium]
MLTPNRIYLVALLAGGVSLLAQQPVSINVDLGTSRGKWNPAWAFFGYDEPNYTYTQNGRKLLRELSAASPTPVYIRTHNLLTSGDGTASLKWGSTNAYVEDAAGRPVYNWSILDRIFDTYQQIGVRPLVEIGFMPEALSTHPEPYRHTFPNGSLWTGWAYPPKDYHAWAELIYQWVRHCAERYGAREVENWYWEVWNEPDIGYWRGTPEEYYKLYDFAADAVKRALPAARIGGPHCTGPAASQAANFLRGFLEHVLHGKNFATGKMGSPLDYVGFHAKGNPHMLDGHVEMGIRNQARNISSGFEIVASFPELNNKPIIIGESDPEGCAACSAKTNPQNAYRNGPLYASYTAAIFYQTLELAARDKVRLTGAATWAFEFEDQPWFEGFRTLATNGVSKPVLNLFRMLGMLNGERVETSSNGAVSTGDVLEAGVRSQPDINALATKALSRAAVLVWNYHDDDVEAVPSSVKLRVARLPAEVDAVLLRHYRIDNQHSNAFTAWKKMGVPQMPTPVQHAELEAAGQLMLLESPQWMRTSGGAVEINFELPRQAVSLLELEW